MKSKISPEDAEEYTQSLGQITGGSWRQIALAHRMGVPQALGLSTQEWVRNRLGGYVRLAIEDRQEAVVTLVLEDGLSQHEAADVLGVSQSTVSLDLDNENSSLDGDTPGKNDENSYPSTESGGAAKWQCAMSAGTTHRKKARVTENSLALFSRGAAMLAEADTIQKAKELKNLALTAAEWARRKGMGEEAILHCKSYALEAERKMGEMLLVAEKAKGARGSGSNQYEVRSHSVTASTLDERGLSKRDSAEAQTLATMAQETFEALKAGTKTRRAAEREMRRLR